MRITILSVLLSLVFSSAGVAQNISGTYAIKNVSTGMLLRVMDANKKDATPIVAYTPTNWKCMTWDFDHLQGNTYFLRNLFTNKTFQPQREESIVGTPLEQQPADKDKKAQQWEFIGVAENTYLIKSKGSELYITPADSTGTINSKIVLAKKRADKLQYWTIYEQHPDM